MGHTNISEVNRGIMATGSYLLGAVVKIPVQVTLDGLPYPGQVPVIEKIIKPNGTLLAGLPTYATVIDEDLATYYYSFTPATIGDYIVIIKSTINSEDYITVDNFTVANIVSGQVIAAPRAEPK